jgi:hypothetical protein
MEWEKKRGGPSAPPPFNSPKNGGRGGLLISALVSVQPSVEDMLNFGIFGIQYCSNLIIYAI